NLHVPAAIAIDGYALAVEPVRQPIDLFDVFLGRVVGEVAGLGDGDVVELLERRLHRDVPLGLDGVGGDEDTLPLGRNLGEIDVAGLRDLPHQLVRVPALRLGNVDSLLTHIGRQGPSL